MHLASNLLSRFLVCIPGWFGACAFLLDLFHRSFFTGAFTGAFLLDLFPRGPCAVESHPLGRAAGGSPLRIFWLQPKGNFLTCLFLGRGLLILCPTDSLQCLKITQYQILKVCVEGTRPDLDGFSAFANMVKIFNMV